MCKNCHYKGIFKPHDVLNYTPPTGATEKRRTVKRRGEPLRYNMCPLQGHVSKAYVQYEQGHVSKACVQGICPIRAGACVQGMCPIRAGACVQYEQGHVFKACVQYEQGHVSKACVQYEQGHVFNAHLFARTQIPYLPHIRSCFADWKPLFCRRPALPVPLSAAKTVVPQKRSAAEGMQRPCGGYRSAVRKVCFGNAGDQLRERPGYAIAKNAAKTAG